MMALPKWAKAPGPDWSHRGNFSDIDVVWYHEPTNKVVYQLGSDNYVEPGQPVTGTASPTPPKPLRFQRTKLVTLAVALSTAASTVVHHFWKW